jgi:hypothetical protein
MRILFLLTACGSEHQIVDPNAECETSGVSHGAITYELSCPDIPACPTVNLTCPELDIPTCPDVHVLCPEPVITVEAPTVINESPDITVEPSQCNTTYNATCECPEIEIPECPSLDSITVELDAELTIDGDDFLADLANLLNGPQDLVFYGEAEDYGTGTHALFENNDTRDFILTGIRFRQLGNDCNYTLTHDGFDLIWLSPTQSSANQVGAHSLLTSNNGTLPILPGETIDLDVTSCWNQYLPSGTQSSATDEFRFAMMGYYQ